MTRLILLAAAFSVFVTPALADDVSITTHGAVKIITIAEDESDDTIRVFSDRSVDPLPRAGKMLDLSDFEIGDDVRLIAMNRTKSAGACAHAVRRDLNILEERNQFEVCYNDLAPITTETATRLYARLERAARRACPQFGSVRYAEVLRCRNDAVEASVYDIGSAELLSVHWAETGRPENSVPVGKPQPF